MCGCVRGLVKMCFVCLYVGAFMIAFVSARVFPCLQHMFAYVHE
jgi:hypothetical protein